MISFYLSEPIIEEKWVAMTYFYSGIFVLDGQNLRAQTISSDVTQMLEVIRNARAIWPPRIFSKCLIVPVYCADGFNHDVVNFCASHKLDGFGWSAHPLLYDKSARKPVFKEAVQNQTLLIYEYLNSAFEKGLKIATHQIDTKL